MDCADRKIHLASSMETFPAPVLVGRPFPALKAPPVPQQSIPGVLGVTGRVLGHLRTFLPRCSSSSSPFPGCQENEELGVFPHRSLSSTGKGSWEGMRRFVLMDFGTWREDRGVQHFASAFPFLPASGCPHFAFLPREPPHCRDGGCRAAVDNLSLKGGFFCGWGEGTCISSHLPEAGWCDCFWKTWIHRKKKLKISHREEVLLTALCLFFFFHLLPLPVCLASYLAWDLPEKKPSFSLFWQISSLLECLLCLICVLILVLFSGCAHLSFSKYLFFHFIFISMLSLANIPSAAFPFIDTLLVSQPRLSPSLGGFNFKRGGKIWVWGIDWH